MHTAVLRNAIVRRRLCCVLCVSVSLTTEINLDRICCRFYFVADSIIHSQNEKSARQMKQINEWIIQVKERFVGLMFWNFKI